MNTAWTKENLQKLLAAMKTNISEHDRMSAFYEVVKTLDWEKVAFPPFSPRDCQEKWKIVSQKMRKFRTLTELVDEAADELSNPTIKLDPDPPKRPGPPNCIFYKENMDKYHEQNPGLNRQKLFSLIVNKYKALTDEEKAPYVEKYQRALEEYNKKIVELRKESITKNSNITGGQQGVEKKKRNFTEAPKGKRGRWKKSLEESTGDALPAKPPTSGYSLFCKEQLASMDGVAKKHYVSTWAKRWRKLSDNEKNSYSTRCKKMKKDYAVKLNEYLSTLDRDEQLRITDENGIKRPKSVKNTKVRLKSVKKYHGEPKKPLWSGNSIFCKEHMEQMEEIPNPMERFIQVSRMWNQLSNSEKSRYNSKVKENVRKYATELQKWFMTLPAEEQDDYCASNSSDSEDEDMEVSSSDEDERYRDDDEEEEDDIGDTTFDMF
ncbi:nucleolar transcription factor 1-like isoform X2 [Dunckerocampus dactyliophorus]|uniref:nucleolar transcription factor 1-like isoform X2 n=1 Tax=Dunckerocampus dactyliophorus TaxID=161453 RepID=UPI0024064752|nr:nucleolar transcription factor 1-like isoform X2 [Dunckerocampus dactyliophorus]